ncbi:hypothetical protein NQ314_015544 [Rhamnusium bicolor]|uniref:DUF4806 domain-containing protein n=1 Tax=Rhamnusium bicolor TaxID=1586634 RepID=A0AAV8WY66_9CUCU|nr:hypothetical protein NQ314_015544 [Rhamnusium bicolor]
MTFVGVEFAANEGLAIVSVNWLTHRKKEVFWPDSKKQSCYEKLLKNHTIPDEDSWQLYSIQRCFFNTDTYEKARQKLKKAELTSDLQSDESDSELLESKKVRARKRPISESSDSGDSDESKQTCELKRPEKNSITILKPKDTIALVSDLDTNTMLQQTLFHVRISSSPIPEILGSLKAQNLILGTPGSSKVRNPIPETPSGSLISGSSFSTSSTLRENSALETNDKLLSSIFYVREQNKLIISLLTQIVNKQSSENAHGILEEIPHLPINTEENFIILENSLESDDNLKKLKLGGKDAISKVNIILKKILTNELASGYNFFGKRPGKKPFSTLRLNDAITRKNLRRGGWFGGRAERRDKCGVVAKDAKAQSVLVTRLANKVVPEKMILTKILTSLPDSYKHFVSAWDSVPTEKQTITELTARLLIEEQRTINRQEVIALTAKQKVQENLKPKEQETENSRENDDSVQLVENKRMTKQPRWLDDYETNFLSIHNEPTSCLWQEKTEKTGQTLYKERWTH